MNIRETFLELTSKTYPYGYEEDLEKFLPNGFTKDAQGNYFYKVGESRTAFACHLDTACKFQTDVKHTFIGNLIKSDGKSILGADDKAGVTVLLYLIEKNVPGLYCFFVGEEVGCIGSGYASTNQSFKDYDRMISFDRRGYGSIITHQSSLRCCSDEFGNALAKELNMHDMNMSLDNTGVYTDSAEFIEYIPECTNISVGYYHEHTHQEQQDISHLVKLCKASVLVDWESLPVKRDPKSKEYKSWTYKPTSANYSSADDEFTWNTETYPNKHNKKRGKRGKSWKKNYKNNNWGEYDDDYITNTRIPSQNGGRIYYNTIDNDITEQFEQKSKNYYETLKQYIFEDKLTAKDFDRLKDNYLDMNDPYDVAFYEHMMKTI